MQQGCRSSSTQSLPSSSVDDLVGGLDGLRTAGGVSASDVLLHKLREQLEGTLGGLEMGMGEEGGEGEGGGLASLPPQQPQGPSGGGSGSGGVLTQAIRSLEMGMGEGGGAAAAAAATTAARPQPPAVSDLDVLAARLEGLGLQSNAGTAVRAVKSGAQSGAQWKWRPREK